MPLPEITRGLKYRLGSYKSPERHVVIVTRFDPNQFDWYDDHQEGGWESKGVVYFRYEDPLMNTMHGETWEALEYAKDNWSEASELQALQAQAEVHIARLQQLIEQLPWRGDTEETSQKVCLQNALNALERNVTGLTADDLVGVNLEN